MKCFSQMVSRSCFTKQDYVNIFENANNNHGIYAWEKLSKFNCLRITVRVCIAKDTNMEYLYESMHGYANLTVNSWLFASTIKLISSHWKTAKRRSRTCHC